MVQTVEAVSLEKIARAVWTPPERLSVDQWADRNRVLIAEAAAEPGKWSTDRTPYLRGPMRAFTDPRVRMLVLMFGSQLGKTEMIANCLFYAVDRDPGPTLFVYPNDKLATSTNRDRLVPTIQATPAVARHLTESPQDVKGLQITFDSMNLWFTGANNATNVKGRPCRYVFKDEIDEFPPGASAMADERVKTFPDSKIIDTSTPSDVGLGVDAEYAKTDQRRYEVPCPHCGVFQELVFENLAWDGGSEASPDQAEKSARYVCPHCGCECYDHDKPGMLARGVWVREGEKVETDGTVSGTPLRPDSAAAGFRLSSLYSPFSSCSWGHVVRKFAEAGYVLTREFVTGWLGKAWALQADKVEARELSDLFVPMADGGFRARTVPETAWDERPGPLALVLSIDIQDEYCWLSTYGLGAGGRDVFVIDHWKRAAPRGGNLLELDDQLDLEYDRGGRPMRAMFTVIDTGYGMRTTEAYTFCRRMMQKRKIVIPTKGRETMPGPHTPSAIDKWPDGTAMPGGLKLLLINTDHWKSMVVGMIKRQGDPDLVAMAGGMYLPDLTTWAHGDEFARQVTAEHKVVVPDRNSGKRGLRPVLKTEWRIKPQYRSGGNHAFDTLVGALAAADFMGVRALGVKAEKPAERDDRPGRSEQAPGRARDVLRSRERTARMRERLVEMRERMGARR